MENISDSVFQLHLSKSPPFSFVLELTEEAQRDIQQVADWTKEYAELLDPLSDIPDSIDEFVHPEHEYPWLKS
jgi:hypothetical protein